jgi:hypothetical protein
MRKLLPVLISLLTVPVAAQEACVENSEQVAEKAYAIIQQATNLKIYCAECNDPVPKKPVVVKEIAWEAGRVNGTMVYSVIINDEPLDLTNAYVELDGEYQNLGFLSHCVNKNILANTNGR